MEALSHVVQEAAKLEAFDDIHAAAAVTRAGNLLKEEKSSETRSISADSTRQFAAIVRVARPFIGNMKERALTNFIWALGCSGMPLAAADDDAVLEELIDAARLTLDNFNAQDLSNTAWSLAVLGHGDSVFMTQLVATAMPKLHEFIPHDLANMVYALAKQKQHGSPGPRGLDMFLKELTRSATEQLSGFNCQALSNTAWSLAVMRHDDPVFMAGLLAAAIPKLREFKPQEFSNIVYALAKQKERGALDPHGLDLFLSEFFVFASAKLGSFTVQALCNTTWALAILGYRDLHFQRLARAAVESREHTLNPKARSDLKYWLGKLA